MHLLFPLFFVDWHEVASRKTMVPGVVDSFAAIPGAGMYQVESAQSKHAK
jgi:hypothetical protein